MGQAKEGQVLEHIDQAIIRLRSINKAVEPLVLEEGKKAPEAPARTLS